MLEKSLLYYWIHHVQLVCLVRCPLLVCISSYIIHLHQYQPMSTCLIWNGCSFEACDWLCGGLFCLSAVFPSIRGFLFGAPPCPSHLVFSSCSHAHGHTHSMKALTRASHSTVAFFGQIVVPPSLREPTYSPWNSRVLCSSTCSSLNTNSVCSHDAWSHFSCLAA